MPRCDPDCRLIRAGILELGSFPIGIHIASDVCDSLYIATDVAGLETDIAGHVLRPPHMASDIGYWYTDVVSDV